MPSDRPAVSLESHMGHLDPTRYKRHFGKKFGHGHSYEIAWDTTENKLAVAVDGTVVSRLSTSGLGAVQTGDVTTATDGTTTIGTAKVLSAMLAANVVQVSTGTISSADIVATAAGKFGHANGYPLLDAVGAHNAPEFISAILIYDYAGAAYADGGNITVSLSGGGAAQSDLVSAANFCGAVADKLVVVRPPTAVAAVVLVENAGLNLVTSAAFTNGGTATGVIRYALMYRIHATGL